MKGKLDNTTLWNEAAKAGALLGLVSVSCLVLKELAGMSGSAFLAQAAVVILWSVEFFGCILLMKKVQLDLRDKYENVKMEDTFRLGRRAAALSGLLLASAQALIILYMPQETMDTLVSDISQAMSMTSSQKGCWTRCPCTPLCSSGSTASCTERSFPASCPVTFFYRNCLAARSTGPKTMTIPLTSNSLWTCQSSFPYTTRPIPSRN